MMERAMLKKLFADGSRPVGADFAQLIDSLRHVNDVVPMSLVEGLSAVLSALQEKINSCIPMVRLQYMADGGVYPDEGKYWYIPTSGVLITYDGKSSQQVALRYDALYVNDDDTHGYARGLYVLGSSGKLELITG